MIVIVGVTKLGKTLSCAILIPGCLTATYRLKGFDRRKEAESDDIYQLRY
jgi:hypothetical protein